MNTGSDTLLRLKSVHLGELLVDVGLLLSSVGINVVLGLASSGVQVGIDLLLLLLLQCLLLLHLLLLCLLLAHDAEHRLLHRLNALLLLVHSKLLLLHLLLIAREREVLELLGSSLQVVQFLLESSLLLGKVHVGGDKLSVHLRIHLILVLHANLGRSKHLLHGELLLIALLLLLLLLLAHHRVVGLLLLVVLWHRSLGTVLIRALVLAIDAVTVASKALGGGRRHALGGGTERSGRGRLRSCSETRKKVRAACPWGGSAVVLGRRGAAKGERLQVLAPTTRGEAGAVHLTQAVGLLGEVVGVHLSETAGVHCSGVCEVSGRVCVSAGRYVLFKSEGPARINFRGRVVAEENDCTMVTKRREGGHQVGEIKKRKDGRDRMCEKEDLWARYYGRSRTCSGMHRLVLLM